MALKLEFENDANNFKTVFYFEYNTFCRKFSLTGGQNGSELQLIKNNSNFAPIDHIWLKLWGT